MNEKDLSYMTVPELVECLQKITEELTLRCMQQAGETARMVCGDTGQTCCWCKANCEDRREEE